MRRSFGSLEQSSGAPQPEELAEARAACQRRKLPSEGLPVRYLVPDSEMEISAVRASGPGGQHVNKTSTAVQLRFDVAASGLPAAVKTRLLAIADRRLSTEGVLILKAQSTRSLASNKAEAIARLHELIEQAFEVPKARRATKPTFGSKQRRLAGKAQRATVKSNRGRVRED